MGIHSNSWFSRGSLRIVLPVTLTFALFVCGLFLIILPMFESRMIEQKREMLRAVTETILSDINHQAERVEKGEISLEEAQRRVVDHVRPIRYGPDFREYFWIVDQRARLVLHPYRPDLEDVDLSEYKDLEGRPLFPQFLHVAEEPAGGYVDYDWQWQDRTDRISPKMSYLRAFEPWGWVIGTGAYLDDVDAQVAAARRWLVGICLTILGLAALLCGYAVWQARAIDRGRLNAERQLRDSEMRYRTLFDSARDAIFLLEGIEFVECNARSLDLFRCTPDQLLGATAEVVSAEFQPSGERSVDLIAELRPRAYQGESLSFEWRHRRFDGEEFDAEVSLTTIRLHDNVYLLATVRDITERRILEERLRHAQKMEAIGKLAGGVAHDFNNLLQAILGFSEMALEETEPASSIHEEISEVRKAADRARILVRQLLAFSRRQVLDLSVLCLSEVVHDISKMIQRVIGENYVLNVHAASNGKSVRADRGQVEQILLNLCVNARDAMPGGGEITVRTMGVTLQREGLPAASEAEPGEYVLLSVADTGCGIDAEAREHIFEPFYSTKGPGKGTGLGLATVYGIVQQHGGFLEVESHLGNGTEFKIYLPALDEAVATPDEAAVVSVFGGTETVLIAEDDEGVRAFAVRLLEQAGYRVLAAKDGDEAVKTFDTHADAIRIALLDVVMPKLGGRAVYDHICKARPGLPVVFASGYAAQVGHTGFVLDAGVRLVQKPYKRDTLLRNIRETLDGNPPPR